MTVVISDFARKRLHRIWLWVRDNSSSERADKVEARLIERVEGLLKHPLKGPLEPTLTYMNKGHRFLLLGRYKIIHRVEGLAILITDFFDTKQHPSHMRG